MRQFNNSFCTRAQTPCEGVVIDLVIYANGKPVAEVPATVTLPTVWVENGGSGWAGVLGFNATRADRYTCSVTVNAQERQSLDALENAKNHDACLMACVKANYSPLEAVHGRLSINSNGAIMLTSRHFLIAEGK